jgi:salicylate hydroxylase
MGVLFRVISSFVLTVYFASSQQTRNSRLTFLGIRSICRKCFPGMQNISPKTINEFAYRAVIPASLMASSTTTAALLASEDLHVTCAPGRSLVIYPVGQGKYYNLAMLVPRTSDTKFEEWTETGDVEAFKGLVSDFHPRYKDVVGLVERCTKWTLAEVPDVTSWWSGRAVLLGDAVHAISPAAGQGAAMAMEDAAVLGECLDGVEDVAGLREALSRYQAIRQPRTDRVAELTNENAKEMTLNDGPEQQARDARLRAINVMMQSRPVERSPEATKPRPRPTADSTQPFGTPPLMMWLYGYNVFEAARMSN